MHQQAEPAPTAPEKRRAFARFGRGWDAFARDERPFPPAAWPPAERDLFYRGYEAAAAAAEEMRGRPL